MRSQEDELVPGQPAHVLIVEFAVLRQLVELLQVFA
jgi:hypothetical protein